MAHVQKLTSRSGIQTFGDIVDEFQMSIFSAYKESDVQIVTDRYYNKESIKTGERR